MHVNEEFTDVANLSIISNYHLLVRMFFTTKNTPRFLLCDERSRKIVSNFCGKIYDLKQNLRLIHWIAHAMHSVMWIINGTFDRRIQHFSFWWFNCVSYFGQKNASKLFFSTKTETKLNIFPLLQYENEVLYANDNGYQITEIPYFWQQFWKLKIRHGGKLTFFSVYYWSVLNENDFT